MYITHIDKIKVLEIMQPYSYQIIIYNNVLCLSSAYGGSSTFQQEGKAIRHN